MSDTLTAEAPAELVDAPEIPPPSANGNPRSKKQAEQKKSLPFPAYYDSARKCYWVQNNRGGWIEINETGLRRLVKSHGFSASSKNVPISEVDTKIKDVQLQQDVAYAGPLAGYKDGVMDMYGSRILVTKAPTFIEPKEGTFPMIQALLDNLFFDPQCDQRPYLLGWLKVAIESLSTGQHRPGQALAIAGPRDSGKSLFQNLLTVILGGRAAKPYRYMSGHTPFNGELFECEHLMIEDDIASTDFRARRNFGTHIKDFTVNELHSCHAKNRQAISLKPIWRLSITFNEEQENLMILPPLDDSLRDKIILLKAQKRPMPMPTNTQKDRLLFWETLISELPAFVWHLSRWEIPAELRSDRFGVKHFHHPELLDQIEALTPETQLLEILKIYFKATHDEKKLWEGTAAELESLLINTPNLVGCEARKLLSYPNAIGSYLGRLEKKHPEHIKDIRTAKKRSWRITLPLSE